MSKRDEERMPPIAGMVPQNIATPAGRRLSPLRQPAIRSRGARILARRPFLVGDLLAAFLDEAAQDELVPVRLDLLEAPGRAADHLGADLLGMGDAVALELAVGMVGADRDPEPVGGADQHRLGLARRVVAQRPGCVSACVSRLRGDAVVQRHLRRRLHADRLQLLDVMLQRRDIAAGPAGDHQVVDVDATARPRPWRAVELQTRHRQRTASCEFSRSVTSM